VCVDLKCVRDRCNCRICGFEGGDHDYVDNEDDDYDDATTDAILLFA